MPADDATWRPYAVATRDALAMLGHAIEVRCLPDEAEPCGGGYAQHAVAYLAILKAIADHQIDHAGMPEMAAEIYGHERSELTRGCPC